MVAHIKTVAFSGIEARAVDVQVVTMPGKVGISIVGLADKAIAESKERVQAAIHSMNLSTPVKKVTINLAPADLPKEGSHYDLPIAIGLLASMDILPKSLVERYVFLGELSLDGSILPVQGTLPAALFAQSIQKGLVCPYLCGPGAGYFGKDLEILAPSNLLALIQHFKGEQALPSVETIQFVNNSFSIDLADIKGQEMAKRALKIAASGGHNLLFVGPPGSGKSMLAQRLATILPPLDPEELLEVSLIASLYGGTNFDKIALNRPFRDPHHSASVAAMIGGGQKGKPGELSLAHHGVLFLDELPEFSPKVLDSMRQPLETKECVVARANYHVRYPAHFQLVAAMNPCRCGLSGEAGHVCARGPKCQAEYQARISGPFLDRIDLRVPVPAVSAMDLLYNGETETSEDVLKQVIKIRKVQAKRFQKLGFETLKLNAECPASLIEDMTNMDDKARKFLNDLSEKKHLSARSYHRLLKVARTIADMEERDKISSVHIAEALSYRMDFHERQEI